MFKKIDGVITLKGGIENKSKHIFDSFVVNLVAPVPTHPPGVAGMSSTVADLTLRC